MLYLMKLYALITVVVFSGFGMMILSMYAWREARMYASAQRRIQHRLSTLLNQPARFASTLATSPAQAFRRTYGAH